MQSLCKKIAKSVISHTITLLFTSIFVFLLISYSPGNINDAIYSEEISSTLREEKNGILINYFTFLKNFFSLSWGESLSGGSVKKVILSSLLVTLLLSLFSSIVSLGISLSLSLASVKKRGGSLDRTVSFFTYIISALPIFLIALFLIFVFSFVLHLFPSGGYTHIKDNFFSFVRSLVLPVFTLSIIHSSTFIRQSREVLFENSEKEFSLYALAKGVKRKDLPKKVLLKPSASVLFSLSANSFSSLLGGTIVVESIFSLPGLGSLLYQSVLNRDISTASIIVMIFSIIVSITYFLSDVFSYIIDPRVGVDE